MQRLERRQLQSLREEERRTRLAHRPALVDAPPDLVLPVDDGYLELAEPFGGDGLHRAALRSQTAVAVPVFRPLELEDAALLAGALEGELTFAEWLLGAGAHAAADDGAEIGHAKSRDRGDLHALYVESAEAAQAKTQDRTSSGGASMGGSWSGSTPS